MQFTIDFPPYQTTLSNQAYLDYVTSESQKICQMFLHNGISITSIQNSENHFHGSGYPYFYGFQVVLQASMNNERVHLQDAYKNLLDLWFSNKCAYGPKQMPMLYVSDVVAFFKCRFPQHLNTFVYNMQLGTMPYSGQFSSYANIQGASANFYHDDRKIEIKPQLDPSKVFVIRYRDVRRIIVNKSHNHVELYLYLLHPPVINDILKRLGRNGTYEISKRISTIVNLKASTIGKSNVIRLVLGREQMADEILSRLRFRCEKIPIGFAPIQVQNIPTVPNDPNVGFYHFSCQYLLCAILNRNFLVAEQLKQMYSPIPSHVLSLPEKALEFALTDILYTIDSGYFIDFPEALHSLSYYYKDHMQTNSFSHYTVPEHSREIRRVTITPTRILMYPKEIMFENRVLRTYDPDFSLRVCFRDDNMCRLSMIANYAHDNVFDNAIKNPMTNGIHIHMRHYRFLGWSNSQIRDHGVWMYARDNQNYDVDHIRNWMGDFSHIRSVSKYMARLGQCFTQTEDALSVPLDEQHVKTEPDVEGGVDPTSRRPYCFSDGIGKISMNLASKVQEALGHDKHCSAFQIRYGGYKGMLTIDPTLTETDIVFRQSMKKFDSPGNTRLEIAKTSAPSPLQLNRPFITILEQMGVKHGIFLQLQENMLRQLTDMLLDEEKAAAYLKCYAPKIFKFKELAGSGLGLTTEPFLRSLLLNLHRHHVDKIKNKANINIDPEEGRNMFGVLDETGTLKYGQVFVQYTIDILAGETTTKTQILTGRVLVTKNPCNHPGDVRKFAAVDVPALHHIVDCIVFPNNGPRPHPNEMAGSDLDGDEYTVLWKKELMFPRENFPPANYPSLTPPDTYSIQEADMIQFLIRYIKNDQVGTVAFSHLAFADNRMYGIFSQKCIKLAELFSIAVDFAKNGKEVKLTRDLRPDTFPDFMKKNYKQTYKTKSILGKMYRICLDFQSESQHASASYPKVQVDESLVYPGWEQYKQQALESRDRYNNLLYGVLQTYGVLDESEAFSGAFTHLHYRYSERKDRDEIEKIIISRLKALCRNMKKEFLAHLDTTNSSNLKNVDVNLLRKASAWYIVTYNDPKVIYLSFPWVVSEYLANIKARSLSPTLPQEMFASSVVEKMECMISSCIDSDKLLALSADAISRFDSEVLLCHPEIVLNAFQVLVHWGMQMRVIQTARQSTRGYMYFNTFFKLFVHVARQVKYIYDPRNPEQSKEITSKRCAASLCLAFFQYCVGLRFCNKQEVKKILPFEVYKHKQLAKNAMFTYHQIAIFGTFKTLEFESESQNEYIEMTNVYVDCARILSSEFLRSIEDRMIMESGVQYIEMRPVASCKKIIVSARGSPFAVKQLEQMLRKFNPAEELEVLVELEDDLEELIDYY